MSEVFLAAAAHLIRTAEPPADAAAKVIQAALRQAGAPPRRLSELHWLGPMDAPGNCRLHDAARQAGLPQDLAIFAWPAAPLLDHQLLHAAARSIQSGQRDLVMVGQFSENRAAAALLVSPVAIGRYNLAPRARLAALLAVNAPLGELAIAAGQTLGKLAQRERAARQPQAGQNAPPRSADLPPASANVLPEMLPSGDLRSSLAGLAAGQTGIEETEPAIFDLPLVDEIEWLATCPPLEISPSPAFPQAQRLLDNPAGGANKITGACDWLSELITRLENQAAHWGILLSSQPTDGPTESGLITLIERI